MERDRYICSHSRPFDVTTNRWNDSTSNVNWRDVDTRFSVQGRWSLGPTRQTNGRWDKSISFPSCSLACRMIQWRGGNVVRGPAGKMWDISFGSISWRMDMTESRSNFCFVVGVGAHGDWRMNFPAVWSIPDWALTIGGMNYPHWFSLFGSIRPIDEYINTITTFVRRFVPTLTNYIT